MWPACYTQEEIAEAIGCDQTTITRIITDFMQNGKYADMHKIPAENLKASAQKIKEI